MLTTARLRLRPFRQADLDDYAAICADAEVMRFIGAGGPVGRDAAWRHMALYLGEWALHGYGSWAVERRQDRRLIGPRAGGRQRAALAGAGRGGAYFAGFWSRQGQTLAMKTWHIRLVRRDGERVSPWRALARYLLSWFWFVPALVYVEIQGLRGGGAVSLALMGGVLIYAGLSRVLPQRQFLHDLLCGTRLIDTREPASPGSRPGTPPASVADS